MKSSIDDADRQIIPRWRNSAQAASSPDLLSHKNPTVVPSWRSDIDEKIEEIKKGLLKVIFLNEIELLT